MFYSDEVSHAVHRFDVSARSALRLRYRSAGGQHIRSSLTTAGETGGLLVATSNAIERLDGSGNIVQTYNARGESKWFAVNLDPNRDVVLSGSATTDNFYRFNIATGAKELGPINIGSSAQDHLVGLCVKGELTAAPTRPYTYTHADVLAAAGSSADPLPQPDSYTGAQPAPTPSPSQRSAHGTTVEGQTPYGLDVGMP